MVVLNQYLWLLSLCSSLTVAAPEHGASLSQIKRQSGTPSVRPTIRFSPKGPSKAFPPSPARTKVCTVAANGNGKDDSASILQAIKDCNNGGHVVFPAGKTFTVGTALDLTFLKAIDLDIQGTILFTNDTKYWQANAFRHKFQNATSFFQLGGEDVNVFGGGTLDGNGQAWYDLYAKEPLTLRPIVFATIGLKGGLIANLNLRYSPQWYNIVANSTSVVFDNISISGKSKSSNHAANTDGWDTYRSDNIVIQNSVIVNGDDCVAFKPNSTNILVQNLDCTGSHGISVGSLGQYKGEVDIVEHVYVTNISMSDASDGARIKVWPGVASALSVDLQGGGGTGRVKNVTYTDFRISNVEYAVEITQCYGQKNMSLCKQYPSALTISDILVEGFTGKTSKKHDPVIGSLVCSSPTVCNNITVRNISVTAPSGKNSFTCGNIDKTTLSVNCQAEK